MSLKDNLGMNVKRDCMVIVYVFLDAELFMVIELYSGD